MGHATRLGLAGIAFLLAVVLACALWAQARVAVIDLGALERRAPVPTAVMRERQAEAERKGRPYHVDVRPVSYDRISPLLRKAVLVAEDDAFFSHEGLDWNEIKASARANLKKRRIVRGGSTVTQQLAKNLFLGSARTPLRKLEEVFLAIRIEKALDKRRIFELYLNLIEWGDGIFGVEAAAQRYFGVPSSALSTRQALLLAAVIINPRRFSVLDPPKRIERRVKQIAKRLKRRGVLNDAEYRVAIGAPPDTTALASVPAGMPDSTAVDSAGTAPEEPAPVPAPPVDSTAGADSLRSAL